MFIDYSLSLLPNYKIFEGKDLYFAHWCLLTDARTVSRGTVYKSAECINLLAAEMTTVEDQVYEWDYLSSDSN